jgi:hypothetical protein
VVVLLSFKLLLLLILGNALLLKTYTFLLSGLGNLSILIIYPSSKKVNKKNNHKIRA